MSKFARSDELVSQYRLYNSYGAVITPKPGMQLKETWIPGQARNDKIVKFILKHYTRGESNSNETQIPNMKRLRHWAICH